MANSKEESIKLNPDDVENLDRKTLLEHLTNLSAKASNHDSTERLKEKLRRKLAMMQGTDDSDGEADDEDITGDEREEENRNLIGDSSEPPTSSVLDANATPFTASSSTVPSPFEMPNQGEIQVPQDPMAMMFMMFTQLQSNQAQMQAQMQQREDRLMELLARHSSNDSPRTRSSARNDQATSSNGSAREGAVNVSIRSPNVIEDGIDWKQFKKWRESWENWTTVTALARKDRSQQLATFFSYCSPEFLNKIRHAMGISSDTTDTLKDVLDKIECYLGEQRNDMVDRFRLVRRKQAANESFDDYYVGLSDLAEDANIENMTADDWKKTLIVYGIASDEARQELLGMKPAPSLKKTLEVCRNQEMAIRDDKSLKAISSGQIVAGVGQKAKKGRERSRSRSPQRKSTCFKCGEEWPHSNGEQCKAIGKRCKKCNEVGHFAKCCPTKKASTTTSTPTPAKKAGAIQIGGLGRRRVDYRPEVPVDFYDADGNFLDNRHSVPDTGAQVTVAGRGVLDRWEMKIEDLVPSDEKLENVSGASLHVLGTVILTLAVAEMQVVEKVFVCNDIGGDDIYLSIDVCKGLGIVHPEFPTPLQVIAERDNQRARSVSSIQGAKEKMSSYGGQADEECDVDSIKEKLLEKYKDVFAIDGELKTMNCEPMKIELKENAVPFAIYAPRQIPFAYRDQVEAELEDMLSKGIIERVGDRHTPWCHPMVVVAKPNGSGVRITADLTKLNSQVLRKVHNARSPMDVVSDRSPDARFWTTLDAKTGYWQIELDEESRDYTVFLTPYGKFRYRRSPMGYVSTGDKFNLAGDVAMEGIDHVNKIVDDIIVEDSTLDEHVGRVETVLERCRQHGITLNPKKFVFAQKQVKFAGYIISQDGIEADPAKVNGIAEFPQPKNITDLRSFLGLCQQLGSFSDKLSTAAIPLRALLKKKNAFVWTEEHTRAFEEVKEALLEPPVLAVFDPTKETRLETDASKLNGLGFTLLQKHGDRWRLVLCGSRFLSDVETRYAALELEGIAIKWAMTKCRLYLAGLPHFTVITDHSPLRTIFNKKSIAEVENMKLQKIKAELQSKYVFTVEWRPGKQHVSADCLSRSPVENPEDEEDDNDHHRAIIVAAMTIGGGAEARVIDPIIEDLRVAAREDKEYCELAEQVVKDFTGIEQASEFVRKFKTIKDELSVEDDLVLYGSRIVVPTEKRNEVLKKLHTAHQGIVRTKRRARCAVYWPGLSKDIEDMVERCDPCQERLPSQAKETLASDPEPSRPFEEVATDLFAIGNKHYLVYIDRLSGYPLVVQWSHDPNAADVVRACSKFFSDLGVPVKLQSDGGPQFASKTFSTFLSRWGVEWRCSTPHYHQSNGVAESGVKVLKSLLCKLDKPDVNSEEFHEAILELRNTPRADGRSPNQVLFGSNLRSRVPAHYTSFTKDWQVNAEEADTKRAKIRAEANDFYNRNAHDLEPLKIGTRVRVQDPVDKRWTRIGDIVGVGKHRDYRVKFPSGRTLWRNRRYLRKFQDKVENVSGDENDDTVEDADATGPRRSPRMSKPVVRFGVNTIRIVPRFNP